MRIVNAVARPVVDTHFHDALTDAPGVTGISLFHAANASDYARAPAKANAVSGPTMTHCATVNAVSITR